MTIELYGVIGPGDEDADCREPLYEARQYRDAKAEAQRIGGKVLCFEFEYSDSYVVDDFTVRETEALCD